MDEISNRLKQHEQLLINKDRPRLFEWDESGFVDFMHKQPEELSLLDLQNVLDEIIAACPVDTK